MKQKTIVLQLPLMKLFMVAIERSTLLQDRSDIAQSEADVMDDDHSDTGSIHDIDNGDTSQQAVQSENEHCTSKLT